MAGTMRKQELQEVLLEAMTFDVKVHLQGILLDKDRQ